MKAALDRLGIAPRGGAVPLRLVVLLACLVVGGVFVYAAVPKIRDPLAFALSVFHYQVAPDAAINAIALFLPWLELICGLTIILLPGWRRAAGGLLAGLLVLFAGLQISAILRGIDISCGCFSVEGEGGHIGWLGVARNTGLLLAAALVIVTQRADVIRHALPPRRPGSTR